MMVTYLKAAILIDRFVTGVTPSLLLGLETNHFLESDVGSQ